MITINISNDLDEFDFNGTSNDYNDLIKFLKKGNNILPIATKECDFFPIKIRKIEVEYNKDENHLLFFRVDGVNLLIKGGENKINQFIRSLLNLIDARKGTHFHMDNFGNSDLISQEEISIILNIE